MPRHPRLSGPATSMPASIFQRLLARLEGYRGEVFPFHLGDTHLMPPEPSRLERLVWDAGPAHYRYGPPAGEPRLVAALVNKLRERNGLDVGAEHVQVTAGGTHAFTCGMRAVLDQGEEVLLLAPYWPLVRGHVLAVGARPVEVPFSSRLYETPDADVAALLEPHVGPRTAALYFITPGNPDGKVLTRRQLEGIAAVARRHDLWVFADEVYEDYAFDGRPHVSIATLPGMAERTLTVFSFSKSYAQAGLRVGYGVGPPELVASLRKLANHSIYGVPTAMQRAALAALESGRGFLSDARAEYQEARDEVLARLTVPCHAPEGGTYVFVDLAAHGARAEEVCERLAAAGVLLAPGYAFGEAYATWARLCFTAVPRERLRKGLERMGEVLAGG